MRRGQARAQGASRLNWAPRSGRLVRIVRSLLLLFAVLLAATGPDAVASAQDTTARPRVALVLSSGGARALAQLGVIEALEARRIPIDLVVGSEAGALIGGLYASGQSPAEIRELIESQAWINALDGRVPRRELSWRQRTVERDFLVALPVALGPGRAGVRAGFARTRWLSWLLSSATLQVAGISDFDRLPIPFRALCADLLTGGRVVLAEGDLPQAILASFATPGLYAPVESQGRELASGALLSPLPVDVALAEGADVVVLVDMAATLGQPERLASFLLADFQARLVAGEIHRARGLSRLRDTDIRLAPDVEDLDEGDFRAAARWIKAGTRAVEAASAQLDPLALDEARWEQHLAARRARTLAFPVVSGIEFQDDSGLRRAILRARVETRPGERVDPDMLARDLLRLYGLDYHERIDVRFEDDGTGGTALAFDAEVSRDDLWAPRAGLAFEGVFGQDATFVAGGAFTYRPVNSSGAEWRNRLELGSQILVSSEFWQPIDDTATWFVAPSVAFQKGRTNLTEDDDILASFDVTAVSGRLQVGRTLRRVGDIRVGLVRQYAEADLAIGEPADFSGGSSDQGFGEARLAIDTLDSLALPRTGTIARIVGTVPIAFLGSEEQSLLTVQFDKAATSGRTTVVLGAEYNTALDDEDSLESFFPLGGFLRLSGLGRDSIGGAHAGLARIVGWYALSEPQLERRWVDWYAGGSLEGGQTWLRRDDIALDDLRPSGSLFIAANTLLGPVFLGVGFTDPGEVAGFLTFGNLFGNWDPF